MRPLRTLIPIILITFCTLASFAQDADLFPGGKYDPDIPTPQQILDHKFGERHTFFWEMERFIQAIAEKSDRIQIHTYGKTYQGRNLYTLIISAPDNLVRLDEIRKSNLQLTDPRHISKEQAESIADDIPSIVWLGYNIHGNEASGMEAAIRTIYQLTAGIDQRTMSILENVVCIVDPCQNPDGHDRFVHAVRSVATVKSHPDPRDAEHRSPWPGSRTNHYLFDLNRDFFLKTQIESRQKASAYHHWMPHVFADIHEMGPDATYFFSPPMTPYNEYVKPELMKWWNIIAQANAKAFDHFGWGYYTKESFDAFYPGYGTSYPSINGAVGMTYEQASARGVSIERDDGTVLTLHEAAWHHFTTSMATLGVTADRKKEKVLDFYAFFQTALEEAKSDPMKEIILVPDQDPHTCAKLVTNMLQEGVEIYRANETFSNNRSTSYWTKKSSSQTFPKGSYIIPLNQPQSILIKTLLAPNSPLSDEFIRNERARIEAGDRSHFYDVSGWSLPLTYGIEAYWTASSSGVDKERVSSPPALEGSVLGGPATQAYLIPYNGIAPSLFLVKLLEDDFRVRIARKPFILTGMEWGRGTLVVRVNRNDDSVHDRINELAQKIGVDVTAVNHGLAESGIDLGSRNIATIKKPKIALLTESPVSSYSYGAIHYLFERIFQLSFVRIPASRMGDLSDFDVLVMPSGNYRDWLNENELENLKAWIQAGGTVVSVAGATSYLVDEKVALSKAKLLNGQPDPADEDVKIKPRRTPGAIMKIELDPTSFLAYGCPVVVAGQHRSDKIYQAFKDESRKNVGTIAKDDVLLSGFIWPETKQYLPGQGYIFVEPVGRGKLILFAEDPNFRASYEGLNKVFLNAILLGPSLR